MSVSCRQGTKGGNYPLLSLCLQNWSPAEVPPLEVKGQKGIGLSPKAHYMLRDLPEFPGCSQDIEADWRAGAYGMGNKWEMNYQCLLGTACHVVIFSSIGLFLFFFWQGPCKTLDEYFIYSDNKWLDFWLLVPMACMVWIIPCFSRYISWHFSICFWPNIWSLSSLCIRSPVSFSKQLPAICCLPQKSKLSLAGIWNLDFSGSYSNKTRLSN